MACCTNCGAENREGSRFCNECGSPLGDTLRCGWCGLLNSPTNRCCSQCGSLLQPAAAASPSRSASEDPPAPVPPPAEGDQALEFEPPGFADLLTDPSLAASPAAAEQPVLGGATAPDPPAPTDASSLAEIALPAEALPPVEMATEPVAAVSNADTRPPGDALGGLPAVPEGVKAGAQQVLDSTWLDHWPEPPTAAAPTVAVVKETELPPLASPEPASAATCSAGPAALVISPEGPPAWPDGREHPAAADLRPLSGVAADLAVPPLVPPEQRPTGVLAAGIVRARSAPAGLAAAVALAPAGPPHPAEAVPLFARIVAGRQPPPAASARQHRPHHDLGSGRPNHRPLIVLVLLLVVGLAVALAFVTGHLPPDVSLARIGLG